MLEGLFLRASKDALEREAKRPFDQLMAAITSVPRPINIYEHLSKLDRIRLIAEIKRASPSKGFLAEIPQAGELAKGYEQSGADAISVLTEASGFRGNLEDLEQASRAVSIPTLRKDFISSEYQILEARVAGASFVLLILSYIDQARARELSEFAASLGLGVLFEAHKESEIEAAGELGAKLIGINTRDLTTFKTDLGLFEKLAGLLPSEAVAVAESSVKTIDDVRRYRSAGADAVLVGEALVTGDWRSLIPQIVSVA